MQRTGRKGLRDGKVRAGMYVMLINDKGMDRISYSFLLKELHCIDFTISGGDEFLLMAF